MGRSSRNRLLVAVAVIASACGARQLAPPMWTFAVHALNSGSTSSMRGLSVVDERIVWASGTGGVVLRTVDGGATWLPRNVPDGDSLDFRDIEAFDSLNALVLSAGEDGRIYRTSDGGATWKLEFRNQVRGAFFDCFAFFSPTSGIVLSDPVEKRFLILRLDTAWTPLPPASRPLADSTEAAFASSGSCLTIAGERAYFATGGGENARVFSSADRGATWQPALTPVPAGATAGIFSLTFRDENNGIAIGGDYQKPQQAARLALTSDGGKTWHVAGQTSYVSGAAWSKSGEALIAVGTTGTRLSRDRGVSWMALDTLEYNAVQFAGEHMAYAVGPRGRIAKLLRR